jgi:hypothetical protein
MSRFLYDLEINMIGIDLDTDQFGTRLYSESVPQRGHLHMPRFNMHGLMDRRDMLDFRHFVRDGSVRKDAWTNDWRCGRPSTRPTRAGLVPLASLGLTPAPIAELSRGRPESSEASAKGSTRLQRSLSQGPGLAAKRPAGSRLRIQASTA